MSHPAIPPTSVQQLAVDFAKKIVEEHGYTVSIYMEKGESRFTVVHLADTVKVIEPVICEKY
jgi:hypothetical protein